MKPQRQILAAVVLTVLAGSITAGCGDDADAGGSGTSKVSLLLDWTAGSEHIGYVVADELGYYEDAGLDVDISEGQGSATTVKVVGSGKSQFGVVSAGEVMLGVANKVPVTAIATIVQSSPSAVIYNTDKVTVDDLTDLYGHKFGVVTQSSGYKEWQSVESLAGVDASKIEEIDVGQSIVPAILNGDVDAIMGWSFNQGVQAQTQGCSCEWKMFTDFGQPDVPNSTITVNSDFAENDPKQVQAFVDATLKGWQYVADHPDEALKMLYDVYPEIDKEYNDAKLPLVLELMGTPDTFGQFDAAKWQALKDFYSEQGTLTAEVELDGGVYDAGYTK